MISRLQTCQPSRFWRDSLAFLPDVPRPAKSWKCPAFCTKSDFFARAQFVTGTFVTLPRCPDIPNGTAAESPCYSVFWNAKSQCGPCQPSRFFTGKSRFFTRNVPLKTFSRLADLRLIFTSAVRFENLTGVQNWI